jgi:oligopeptidase B
VYEETDELFDIGAGRSLDKKVIFLSSYAKTSTEVRYLPADAPTASPKVILPREARHEYDVDHYGGVFYITTNKGAKNFRVMTAPMSDPSEKNWRVFIAHDPAIRINGLTFFGNHIVVSEREGGLTQLRVIDPKTKQSARIATEESDFALSLGSNPEFNTSTLRFNYQSMVTPSSVYDYDMTTREKKLLKRQEVLGGYDPSKYEAKRVWAEARDGTNVPISIVHRKGIALDGKSPLLL